MDVPKGWRLVPETPTDLMLQGYAKALSLYLNTVPPDERLHLAGSMKHRTITKARLRYARMLDAAPRYVP